MISKIRDKHIKNILFALTIIIIPGFILWGAASFFSSRKKIRSVMEIDGKKIPYSEFVSMKKEVMLKQFMSNGVDFYKQADEEYINSQAAERIILDYKATKENIKVTDGQLLKYIKEMFSVNGKFSKKHYDNFLKSIYRIPRLRFVPAQFEEFLKREIKISTLLEGIFKDIKVSENEIKDAFVEENEKVKIMFAFLPYEGFKS